MYKLLLIVATFVITGCSTLDTPILPKVSFTPEQCTATAVHITSVLAQELCKQQ